ncbi:MAG: Crp/Fnr family transcriptional regulator [Trueperaceae bacterium]|nr:Crp/Fnr family transcriptional regulator [Trueperaceae bacterium]
MVLRPEVLAKLSFFNELDYETLDYLARHSQHYDAIPEQVIFLQGEASKGLYLVESGWLKGSKITESGREQVLRYFGPGETINEVSLFLDIANPATLIVLEASSVWLIPRETVLGLMETNPKVMRGITRNLAKRLLYVVNLVEDLSLLPLEARLAKFLLEHAEDSIFERRRWATQAELAARLGTVPDVLHRVLRSFSEAGLIEVQRQQIFILDKVALQDKTKLS